MIKLLREAAHDYPWFLKSIMGILALAFIITMGWWGFGQQSGTAVASVGDQAIPQDEFRRAYENTYRFYRDKGQTDIKDEFLKQFVLDQLIENRMWLLAAKDMGLTVTDDDLRKAITQRTEFQRNGQFDPDLYRRLLAANHLTPSSFEAMEAKDILTNKARLIVMDAVALTPSEYSEAQALVTRQAEADPAKAETAKERIFQSFLFQKQQRALMAYAESMKTKVPIKIHKELM
ncbi:MAG TPA: SurA N-terminal domain-containing protein [Nitrospiraceae bacterium]|jgi:peptidyl-prolyl cis-trans isomerase D|nr:SurA N-terminal domain-containing protein [Nitrospiraceae bacterium]